MKFYNWLNEMSLSVDDALEIFGMSRKDAEDFDKLQKKYRELSKKHHPDLGGDVKEMQKVSVAYSVLKEMPKGGEKKDVGYDMEERKRKEKQIREAILDVLFEKFDPEIYVRYFEENSDKKFKHDVDWRKSGGMVGFTAEFYTEDMDILFHLRVTANLYSILLKKDKTLAGDKYDFDLQIDRYAFEGNKKHRIGQKSFNLTRDHDFFKKPQKMFTKKKVGEILKKKSKKQFRKADMLESLKRRFNATIDTVDNQPMVYIPIGDGHVMVMDRTVLMKQAGWVINSIYDKNARGKERTRWIKKTFTFMENEESLGFVEKIVEACKRQKTVDDKINVIQDFVIKQRGW